MSQDQLIHDAGRLLTTAEVLYHLPDYPDLLETFLWQTMDHAPKFPRVHQFLTYWSQNIDGKLHSVKIATEETGFSQEFTFAEAEFTLH